MPDTEPEIGDIMMMKAESWALKYILFCLRNNADYC